MNIWESTNKRVRLEIQDEKLILITSDANGETVANTLSGYDDVPGMRGALVGWEMMHVAELRDFVRLRANHA